MEHSDSARKSPPSVLTLSEPFHVPDSFPHPFIRWLAYPIPDVSVDWCVDNLLTKLERENYREKFSNEEARFNWLLGRLCAKETVRELVFNVHDVLIPSNEIEIRTAGDGSPQVFFVERTSSVARGRDAERLAHLQNSIYISITHCAKRAYVLSITTDGKERPGIDCEKLRDVESGMAELVFESNEREFVGTQPNDSRKSEAFFRLWAAREAVLKATNSSEKRPFELLSTGDDHIVVKHKGEERRILTLSHGGYAVAIVCF